MSDELQAYVAKLRSIHAIERPDVFEPIYEDFLAEEALPPQGEGMYGLRFMLAELQKQCEKRLAEIRKSRAQHEANNAANDNAGAPGDEGHPSSPEVVVISDDESDGQEHPERQNAGPSVRLRSPDARGDELVIDLLSSQSDGRNPTDPANAARADNMVPANKPRSVSPHHLAPHDDLSEPGMGEDVYDGDHPDTDVLDTEEPHSPHSPHHHVLMPHLPNSEPGSGKVSAGEDQELPTDRDSDSLDHNNNHTHDNHPADRDAPVVTPTLAEWRARRAAKAAAANTVVPSNPSHTTDHTTGGHNEGQDGMNGLMTEEGHGHGDGVGEEGLAAAGEPRASVPRPAWRGPRFRPPRLLSALASFAPSLRAQRTERDATAAGAGRASLLTLPRTGKRPASDRSDEPDAPRRSSFMRRGPFMQRAKQPRRDQAAPSASLAGGLEAPGHAFDALLAAARVHVEVAYREDGPELGAVFDEVPNTADRNTADGTTLPGVIADGDVVDGNTVDGVFKRKRDVLHDPVVDADGMETGERPVNEGENEAAVERTLMTAAVGLSTPAGLGAAADVPRTDEQEPSDGGAEWRVIKRARKRTPSTFGLLQDETDTDMRDEEQPLAPTEPVAPVAAFVQPVAVQPAAAQVVAPEQPTRPCGTPRASPPRLHSLDAPSKSGSGGRYGLCDVGSDADTPMAAPSVARQLDFSDAAVQTVDVELAAAAAATAAAVPSAAAAAGPAAPSEPEAVAGAQPAEAEAAANTQLGQAAAVAAAAVAATAVETVAMEVAGAAAAAGADAVAALAAAAEVVMEPAETVAAAAVAAAAIGQQPGARPAARRRMGALLQGAVRKRCDRVGSLVRSGASRILGAPAVLLERVLRFTAPQLHETAMAAELAGGAAGVAEPSAAAAADEPAAVAVTAAAEAVPAAATAAAPDTMLPEAVSMLNVDSELPPTEPIVPSVPADTATADTHVPSDSAVANDAPAATTAAVDVVAAAEPATQVTASPADVMSSPAFDDMPTEQAIQEANRFIQTLLPGDTATLTQPAAPAAAAGPSSSPADKAPGASAAALTDTDAHMDISSGAAAARLGAEAAALAAAPPAATATAGPGEAGAPVDTYMIDTTEGVSEGHEGTNEHTTSSDDTERVNTECMDSEEGLGAGDASDGAVGTTSEDPDTDMSSEEGEGSEEPSGSDGGPGVSEGESEPRGSDLSESEGELSEELSGRENEASDGGAHDGMGTEQGHGEGTREGAEGVVEEGEDGPEGPTQQAGAGLSRCAHAARAAQRVTARAAQVLGYASAAWLMYVYGVPDEY